MTAHLPLVTKDRRVRSDRRDTTRVEADLPAWIRLGRGVFQKARTLDLGAHGARLQLDRSLEVGARLALNVKLETREPVSIQATVVWSRDHQVGLQFDASDNLDAMRLRRFHHGRALVKARRAS